jgi:peptidoglycan/LPS O-acetylase OafA/YrhL
VHPLRMSDLPSPAASTVRNAGLDALRAATTLLVVFHHAAITYGGSGGWFYREIATGDAWPSRLLSFFCALNQAWFMGLFFLLAGYYTPAALARKGGLRFLADRALRLGLPWLVFVLLLGPLTIALAQTARGRPFSATLGWLAAHPVFEPGPLWFAQALLPCAVGAVLWQAGAGASRAWGSPAAPFPSNRALALAALATGAAAFGLRLVWPVGVAVAGLQPGYCASYAVLFAAGCAAARPRWLEHLPAAVPRRWRRVARWALPVLPLVALFGPGLPWLSGRVEGGFSLPAVVYAFWEPLVAWGVLLGLLSLFQRRCARPGALGQALARRAFAIFVIHPPVLVAVALAWSPVPAPALLKFVLTGSLACALCFGLAGLLLRVPGVARVL